MARLALIHGSKPSSWVSCQSITSNLGAAYRLAFPQAEIRTFFLEGGTSGQQAFELAKQVLAFQPDRIAFVDHSPSPALLLRALPLVQRGQQPLPELVIHVFGDFSLHPLEWIGLKDSLAKARVRFICASEKQCLLLRSFLDASEETVQWVPFPVDGSVFSFSPALVETTRRAQGLDSGDWVFLYAGRLSLQKNVTTLISAFGTYLEKIDPKAQLWLAGPTDDLGVPYLGLHPVPGWFSEQLLDRIRRNVPAKHVGQVRYLGDLSPQELRLVHHASDCYVSLSTHNDEDFGMAPAEAALCGSPLLLTDWGGFSSFRHIGPEHCSLVPVRIQGRSVLPETSDVLKSMVMRASRPTSPEHRVKIAQAAAKLLSIESVGTRLSQVLAAAPAEGGFRGFSPLFIDLARAYRGNPLAPFLSGNNYSNTYRRIYETYC